MSVFDLTCELMRRASITPEDAGCQDVLAERLSAVGFEIEHLDAGEVRNIWCTLGSGSPLVQWFKRYLVVSELSGRSVHVYDLKNRFIAMRHFSKGDVSHVCGAWGCVVSTHDFFVMPQCGSVGHLIQFSMYSNSFGPM